jgi:hypothetical protein
MKLMKTTFALSFLFCSATTFAIIVDSSPGPKERAETSDEQKLEEMRDTRIADVIGSVDLGRKERENRIAHDETGDSALKTVDRQTSRNINGDQALTEANRTIAKSGTAWWSTLLWPGVFGILGFSVLLVIRGLADKKIPPPAPKRPRKKSSHN